MKETIEMLSVLALEWLVSCGLFKLITLCFGWTFTWKVATGVWLCKKLIDLRAKL